MPGLELKSLQTLSGASSVIYEGYAASINIDGTLVILTQKSSLSRGVGRFLKKKNNLNVKRGVRTSLRF